MSADDHLSPEQFRKNDIVEIDNGRAKRRIALDKDAEIRPSGYVKVTGSKIRRKDNVVTTKFDAAYAHHSTMRKVGRWGSDG